MDGRRHISVQAGHYGPRPGHPAGSLGAHRCGPVAATTSILDGMTVAQLKEYATNNNINITGLTLKADIRAAIEAAEAQNEEG